MTTQLAQVEAEIDAKKANIGEKLLELEDRVQHAAERGKAALSFQHQMAEHPWVVVAGAVGVGLLLGRKSPQIQALIVGVPKQRKEKRKQKNPQAPSAIEHGQRLLMTAVLPGVLGALAKRYVSGSNGGSRSDHKV